MGFYCFVPPNRLVIKIRLFFLFRFFLVFLLSSLSEFHLFFGGVGGCPSTPFWKTLFFVCFFCLFLPFPFLMFVCLFEANFPNIPFFKTNLLQCLPASFCVALVSVFMCSVSVVLFYVGLAFGIISFVMVLFLFCFLYCFQTLKSTVSPAIIVFCLSYVCLKGIFVFYASWFVFCFFSSVVCLQSKQRSGIALCLCCLFS